MHSSKLVAMLYRLTKAEKAAFRKWVDSPYHNQQAPVNQLLDYLLGLKGKAKQPGLQQQAIYQAIFGAATFDLPKLRHLFSKLTLCLEDFLAHRQAPRAAWEQSLVLAQVFQQKQLSHLAQQQLDKAQRILAQQAQRDQPYLYAQYQFEETSHRVLNLEDRGAVDNFQAIDTQYDLAYIAGKLRHSCRLLSHQALYQEAYDMGLLQAVLDHLRQRPNYLRFPAIGLYYYYYKAITQTQGADTYFGLFKHYLLQHQQVFGQEELKELYILATNYSIRRLNTQQGNRSYIQETFELYQEALQLGVLTQEGRISPFSYNNIAAIALGLQHYDWTWQFLDDYAPLLPPHLRQPCLQYNRSRWYFLQQQYHRAAQLLANDDFEDLHLNLSAKVLLLKTYYIIGEWKLLDALLNRFSTYLSRQKKLAYHKQNYTNIIRFTRRLAQINPHSEKAKTKLRQEIEQTQLLTERNWLLEQLDDL